MRQTEKESDIVSALCEYLFVYRKYFGYRQNNIPVFTENRYRAMPKYTPKGLPDIVVICKGQYIGLEVKRQKGKQSPEQKDIEDKIKQSGGQYFVVHSIEEVQKLGL